MPKVPPDLPRLLPSTTPTAPLCRRQRSPTMSWAAMSVTTDSKSRRSSRMAGFHSFWVTLVPDAAHVIAS
jgi:hypothetical protein